MKSSAPEPDYRWGRNLLVCLLYHAIDVNKKDPGNPFSLCGKVLLDMDATVGASNIAGKKCTKCMRDVRVRTNRK